MMTGTGRGTDGPDPAFYGKKVESGPVGILKARKQYTGYLRPNGRI